MVRLVNSNYGQTNTEICIHDKGEIIGDVMVSTNNFFEIEFLDYIAKKFNKQTGILDIGANIGNHSLFFAKFLNCDMVHSFEPFPANVSLLKANTKLHSAIKKAQCHYIIHKKQIMEGFHYIIMQMD
jgi:hypothetical protein